MLTVVLFDTGEGTADHWREAFTAETGLRLSKVSGIVTRSPRFGRRQLSLAVGDIPTREQAVRIGQLVEAKWVLRGLARETEAGWVVEAELVRSASGEGDEFRVEAEDWWAACDRLVAAVLERLAIHPDENELERVNWRWTDSRAALEWATKARAGEARDLPTKELLALLQKAVEADSDSGFLWLELAQHAINAEQWNEAERAVDRASELVPETAELYFVTAYLAGQRGEPVEMERLLKETLDRDPRQGAALLAVAGIRLSEKRGEEALALLERAAHLDPTNARVHSLKAMALLIDGKRAKAEASLREAIRLASGEPPLLNAEFAITNAAAILGDLPTAVRAGRRALEAGRTSETQPTFLDSLEAALRDLEQRLEPTAVQAEAPRDYTPEELQEVFARRLTEEERKRIENPMTVTPEMAAWAREQIGDAATPLEKARALFNVMDRQGGDRERRGSRNAKDVFALWEDPDAYFSCQEYTKLYVGLARELGLQAWWAEVRRDYRGRYVYHVCAAVLIDGEMFLVDPTFHWFGIPHREFTVRDDLQATALHYTQGRDNGGRPDAEARDLAEALIADKLDPDSAYGKLALAYRWAAQNNLDLARQKLAEAEELAPGRWDVKLAQALLAYETGQFETALPLLRKTVKLNPDSCEAQMALAVVLAREVRSLPALIEARAHLREALRLDPDRAREENAYEKIASINEIIGEHDESPAARALRLLEDENWQEAADAFREVLQAQPDSPFHHFYLGRCLVELGELDEAERHFRRTLELNPASSTAATALAKLLRRQGDFDAAEQVLIERLTHSPGEIALLEELLALTARQQKHAAVLEQSREILESDPDNMLARLSMANVLGFAGRFDEAETQLARVRLGADDNKVLWLIATGVMAQLGRFREAKANLDQAELRRAGEDDSDTPPDGPGRALAKALPILLEAEDAFIADLRAGGPQNPLSDDLARQLDQLSLVAGNPALLPGELEECFARNRDEILEQSERRETTSVIVHAGDAAQEIAEAVREKLVQGASPQEAAEEFAKAEKAQVGARSWNARNDLVEALREPVFAVPPTGGVTGVIDADAFLAVVIVHEVRLREGDALEDDAVLEATRDVLQRELRERWKEFYLERLRERIRDE